MWGIMPKPVHDPRRFLRQEKEYAVDIVPQHPVVTLWRLDSNDTVEADVSVDEEIPEYAEAPSSPFLDMPNIQPKVRVALDNAVSHEAVFEPKPNVAVPSEDSAVMQTEPNAAIAAAGNEVAPKQEMVAELQPTGDTSMAKAQDTMVDVGTLNGDRQNMPGTTSGVGNMGVSVTTTGKKSGDQPSQVVNEEQLWQAYAKTLVRYFAKKRSYPPLARKLGQQGTVWIDVELLRSGQITNIELTRSSGSKVLDEAALALVKKADDIPPFPEGITAQKRKIRIPLEYTLRRE